MRPSIAVAVGVYLSLIAGCQSFLVVSTIPRLENLRTKSTAEFTPTRTHRRPPARHGSDSHRASSSRPSSESIEEARQRLMSSAEYEQMVNRVEARNPFAVEQDISDEDAYEEENATWRAMKSSLRLAADVLIVLVPVVVCVNAGVLPAAALGPFESAAAALKSSPIEPILERLPWSNVEVLKWTAEAALALILSPVADRLVVIPAINSFAQAKLKALSSSDKQRK